MLFLLIPPWHPSSVHQVIFFFFHNTLTQPHLSCGYPFVFHLVLDPEGKNPALPCDAGPHLAVPRTRQATRWVQVWGQTRSALDLSARFHLGHLSVYVPEPPAGTQWGPSSPRRSSGRRVRRTCAGGGFLTRLEHLWCTMCRTWGEKLRGKERRWPEMCEERKGKKMVVREKKREKKKSSVRYSLFHFGSKLPT